MSVLVAPAPSETFGPTQSAERIELLDVLRGFALLGILIVNMVAFAHVTLAAATLPLSYATPVDRGASWLIRWLAEGKFYSLFAMLFGLGFILQLDRAEARGRRFMPAYLRRLAVLFAFGVLHGVFFWVGDILAIYAVLGLPLLLFRRTRPRRLLIWSAILLLLPTFLIATATVLLAAVRADPAAALQYETLLAEQRAATQAEIARVAAVYGQGSFAEITAQRVQDLLQMWLFTLFILPNIFAMFLLGVYLARQRIFHTPEAHRGVLRRLCAWGFSLGLPLNAVYATGIETLVRSEPSGPLVVALLAQAVGAPLLALGYAAGLALLWQSPIWQPRLRLLAPPGRMALTNYLLQSLIATWLFYGYGLGWFGKVGIAAGLGLTLAIYVLNVAISQWWLHRFRFGPAEWLWRTLTYLHPQTMIVTRALPH
jgi:uncharacterized protein